MGIELAFSTYIIGIFIIGYVAFRVIYNWKFFLALGLTMLAGYFAMNYIVDDKNWNDSSVEKGIRSVLDKANKFLDQVDNKYNELSEHFVDGKYHGDPVELMKYYNDYNRISQENDDYWAELDKEENEARAQRNAGIAACDPRNK